MGRPPKDAPPSASWVDYWIDNTNYCAFFGCDDSCTVAASALRAGTERCGDLSSSYRLAPLLEYASGGGSHSKPDFAALHDEFLDSLLQEQEQLQQQQNQSLQRNHSNRGLVTKGSSYDENDAYSETGLNHSLSNDSTAHSWTLSPTSSNSSISDGGNGAYDGVTRKRRRGLTPTNHTAASQAPTNLRGIKFPAVVTTTASTASTAAATSSFLCGNENMRPPDSFLHSAVRMQKDKGKGEEVGMSICAKGIPACLGKLREKMQLLTEHTHPGTPATMKRRNAVVSEQFDNFVETRSLLTLKMGFLSMTYGILLRWDAGKTGLATIVVLRKNCHESFYKKRSGSGNGASTNKSSSAAAAACCSSPPLELSPSTSMDETEFDDDLQPPYLVSRPVQFAPGEITVSVLFATGLNKKSHWTVQLQLADQTENILLTYDGTAMVPKLGGPLHHVLPKSYKRATTQLAVLEIRLLEHKVRRKTRVLRCSMVLPLHSLEAVSSNDAEQPTSMRIPCPDGATIQIEAMLVSDESVWQRQELSARRVSHKQLQQQHQPHMSRSGGGSGRRSPDTVILKEEDEDDTSSPWDWFCNVC
jgi:hypothetical protein